MRIVLTALLSLTALVAADATRPMQRFLLPDVYGHDHDSNEYRGKVILLEFMQTGCAQCGAFTAILKQVETRYANRVNIVAVVNPPDLPANISQFISTYHVNYPILLDAGRLAYAYIRKPAFDLPYLFLIDAAGQIRQQYEYGPATQKIFEREALFAALDSLLGAPAADKR